MGALGIKRNRSIDSLWEVNEKTIMALESTLGVVIGSDDGRVLYIQDTGVKEVGRGYIDRATKKVHICKERTEDVINTSAKFADHSIQSIYNKLENLPQHSRAMLKIYTDLECDFNNIEDLNKNASILKNIMDENSKMYEVAHIEIYNKARASSYIKVCRTNGCFYYHISTFSFDAIMKWYTGVTPQFKRFQLIS